MVSGYSDHASSVSNDVQDTLYESDLVNGRAMVLDRVKYYVFWSLGRGMVAREMFKVDCLRNNLKVEKCIKTGVKRP